eukprot:1160499-Pelagomonas_calceolata.AAC.7
MEVQVEPEGLTLLAREAMVDIAHLLRPGHLQQLRNILDDPEASANDKFVALELLKNANIAAGRQSLPGTSNWLSVKSIKGLEMKVPDCYNRAPNPSIR